MSAKILTIDNFRRVTLSESVSDLCVLCSKFDEMVDHLFLHYTFSYVLWSLFLVKCGVLWCVLGSDGFA